MLHGQLASHNAQSATELGVRGHVRVSLEENEPDTEAEKKKRKEKENRGNGNEIFQGSFYCDGSKDIRDFYYYYK